MKPLEHHSETAALCALFVMICTIDWMARELAALFAPFFGG